MASRGSWIWALRILGIGTREKTARRKHIISAVTVVALSVIPLIIAIFLMNGMTLGITQKYMHLSSFHAQIWTESESRTETARSVAQNPIVESVYLVQEAFCLLYSESNSYNTTVKGVENAYVESSAFTDEIQVLDGDLTFNGSASVILSSTIADALEVGIGDTIAVVSVSRKKGAARIKPAIFHVSGIIESGYRQLDERLVFIPIEYSNRLIADDFSTYIGILVNNAYAEDIHGIRAELSQYLDDYGILTTWDQLNRSIYYNFKTSKAILYIIMILIIMVASVNISSTCIIIIQEKYLEIGMLKSMGVGNRIIKRTFLTTSVLIGAFGAGIGISLGLLISLQINNILSLLQQRGFAALDFYLIHIPIIIDWKEISLVGLLTVTISALSAIIPIRRIKAIVPIHMLQE